MTQRRVTESPDAMTQRIMSRKSRRGSAQSFAKELHPILRLQRMLGNQRLTQLIQAKQVTPNGNIIGLQRKLTVGVADDQYEQEADRMARQVMNTSDAVAVYSRQRSISSEQDNDRAPQPKLLAASITPFVPQKQMLETSKEPLPRQPENEKEKPKPIQVKSASALTKSFETANDVETQINRSKGRGSPLPDAVRTYMESRFGADFSGVHVHTGGDSARLNRSLSAQAFTVGREIYYGAGKSPTDLTLTAHELAHVVQQTGGQPAVQRQPAVTEVRNVELRSAPKRPEMQPAVPRAVPASMPLAEEIDAANQLTDDELLKRRSQVALEAAAAANDADGAAREAAKRTAGPDAEAANARKRRLESEYGKLQRTLDAIEYVAKWRRLPPLKEDRFRYQETRRELANRRVNFRLMVEARVRETGSLKEALKGIPADLEEVQAIRKEADDFGKSFKGEAWLNCERMLVASQKVMFSELASYGLPREQIEGGIRRLKEGKSEDEAAQDVVDQILKLTPDKLAEVNAKGPERKRARLVFKVRRLKERQQKVKDLAQTAGGLNTRVGVQSSVDAMNKARRELPVAQNELAAEWMEAEREHQVLAAYRGDMRDLEKIDLTKLDVPAAETPKLMTEVLVRVLPKLYDNGRALYMLRHHQLKPMAMAPVVALTSATMFVPEGSIRAGVVRDLFDEEKSSGSSWLLTLFTVALAIVTLLPTGGMSAVVLVPASIASAGLAAYSALKIYQRYEKQKLLVNTDLDLARALSNEQPSLSGFAFNLVMAGLEGVALFRLWRKAVELRKLAIERQSLSEAIDEFKAIMNEQKRQADTEKFLNEVLRGTPAEKPSARVGEEPKKPAKEPQEKKAAAHEGLKPSPPKAPAGIKKVTSEKAAELGYRDAEHVRAVVTDRLSRLKIGMDPKSLPKQYLDMLAELKLKVGPERAILEHIDAVMGALRNPKLYGDVMADAYQIALANKLTIEEGILLLARKEGLTIKAVPRQKGVLEGGSFFEEYASKGVSIQDLPFKGAPGAPMPGGYHGSVTHIVQDLVINRAKLDKTSYAFRKLLGKAKRKITIVNLEGKQEIVTVGDYVWRSTYDLFERGHLPMPEMSGAVLKQFLKVH